MGWGVWCIWPCPKCPLCQSHSQHGEEDQRPALDLQPPQTATAGCREQRVLNSGKTSRAAAFLMSWMFPRRPGNPDILLKVTSILMWILSLTSWVQFHVTGFALDKKKRAIVTVSSWGLAWSICSSCNTFASAATVSDPLALIIPAVTSHLVDT